mmetsp:Transcript_8665/g.23827  ORF Transcript_8665/g.23827 Transcript_8665/m.23827 type:complete len:286 (+) Transcript_8665:143-1000(+)
MLGRDHRLRAARAQARQPRPSAPCAWPHLPMGARGHCAHGSRALHEQHGLRGHGGDVGQSAPPRLGQELRHLLRGQPRRVSPHRLPFSRRGSAPRRCTQGSPGQGVFHVGRDLCQGHPRQLACMRGRDDGFRGRGLHVQDARHLAPHCGLCCHGPGALHCQHDNHTHRYVRRSGHHGRRVHRRQPHSRHPGQHRRGRGVRGRRLSPRLPRGCYAPRSPGEDARALSLAQGPRQARRAQQRLRQRPRALRARFTRRAAAPRGPSARVAPRTWGTACGPAHGLGWAR